MTFVVSSGMLFTRWGRRDVVDVLLPGDELPLAIQRRNELCQRLGDLDGMGWQRLADEISSLAREWAGPT